MKGLTNALRGIGGEYELTRVVGAFGGIVYVIATNAFVGWHIHKTGQFDITAYCLAFPGGLAAVCAAIAGAARWKDQGVANAKVTEKTGAIPAKPPAGPRVPPGPPPPVENDG